MPFFFGWIQLRCGFNLTLGKWTMLLRSILVTLCIMAQIKVYFVTRKYLRQAEVEPPSIPMQPQTTNIPNNKDLPTPTATMEMEIVPTSLGIPAELSVQGLSTQDMSVSEEHQKTQHSSSLSATKNAPFFVHRRNKTVSKLELEASLTLVVGVLSLCVITGNRSIKV